MAHKPQILILMGPTGSGKSALALRIAQSRPTVIINADAMQMVDTFRVLTARPTEQEESQAEHALYGVLPPHESTSVAVWLRLAEPVIRRSWAEDKLPLIVGGTGMYVKALMDGLSRIPPTPQPIRARIRNLSAAAVRTELEANDPAMAAKLKPGDSQRNARALEVLEATGTSLDAWQKLGNERLFPDAEFAQYYMQVDREILYPRINARFKTMLQNGALDETRTLMERNLPLDTPILRAHGAPELMAHLRGEMTLADATSKAQQNTRNYAKRQMTWIRNQMADATALAPGEMPKLPEVN